MATLNTEWKADDIALNYIYPTLDNVSALIKGVTINPDVSVAVGGASAYYYKDNAPSVTDGDAGRQLVTNKAGNTRTDILLNQSFQIDELIPKAASHALSVDVVGDYMVKAAASVANAWSRKGIVKMIDEGTADTGTASTASTIYSNIIDTIAAFDNANPTRSLGANYVMVTPNTLALIRKSDEFVGNTATGKVLMDGLVGSIGGLSVVLSKQLGTITATDLTNYSAVSGIEFVVGSYDAFVAPTAFEDFRVIESELYFGVKIQAELTYGFDVADANRIHWRAASATEA